MEKEDMMQMMPQKRMGMMLVAASLLIALGMIGSAFLLSRGNFAPTVNVTSGPSNPTVYVSSSPIEHSISVTGEASEKATPDLLTIEFSVKTDNPSAKASMDDNAAVVADVLSNLSASGVQPNETQTVSYDVEPDYNSTYVCDGNNNCHYNSEITGYTTTQVLTVTTTDLSKGGNIIDAASSAGNNQVFVDYTQFSLQDSTQRALEKSLLSQASEEAKSRAQAIADGLGISLGSVQSASESFNYPIPYQKNYLMAAAMPSAAPTQLSPGQVEVSVTVSSSFAVGS